MRSGSQDGPTAGASGRGVVPVSRSRRRGGRKAIATNATSGPSGPASSASASLSASLANRLQARLDTVGSMLFRQTWRTKVTPSGQLYWAHTASARPTSDSACGSWPTPQATEQLDTPEKKRKRGSHVGLNLAVAASWATPTTRDHKDGSFTPNVPENALLGRQVWQVDSGPMLTGSPAETAKPGQLNPAHSRWLMGYPAAWDVCAAMGTR